MEPPILEYARYHGVASDHLAVDPNSHLQCPNIAALLTPFNDPENITQVEDTRLLLTERQNEKLDISKREASFLSAVMKVPFHPESTGSELKWDSILPDYRSGARTKAEMPILRTDHDVDMLSFRAQVSLDQIDLDLPLEPIDNEQDEGLKFPSYCQGLPDQMQERTANEKLDCTRETLQFLEKVRGSVAVSLQDTHSGFYEGMLHYSKRSTQSITPPVLSRMPTPTPFMPPASVMEMEVAPDDEALTLFEVDQMDRLLSEDFNLERTTTGPLTTLETEKFYENALRDVGNSRSSESGKFVSPKRPLLMDPKVDGPITPPVSTKKQCTLEQRNLPCEILRNVSISPLADMETGDEHSTILDGTLAEDANSAKKEIEDRLNLEHPRTINPSLRMEVPRVDEYQPQAPWAKPASSTPNGVESLSLSLRSSLPNCHWGSTLEETASDSSLQWNPFPDGIHKPELVEIIDHEEDIFDDLLVNPEGTSKTVDGDYFLLPVGIHGTRLSNEDVSDDEEDFVSPRYPERGKESIVHPLRSAISADTEQSPPEASIATVCAQGLLLSRSSALVPCWETAHTNNGMATTSSLLSSQFSAGKRLASFMDTRGLKGKHSKVEDCPYFMRSGLSNQSTTENARAEVYVSDKRSACIGVVRRAEGFFPVTDNPEPLSQRALVVSYSLLRSHRAIIRKLEALTPPATLVFRDLIPSASDSDAAIGLGKSSAAPGSTVGQRIEKNELEEADISLSPSTGIILTTSQATTQLYLPGHRPANSAASQQSPLRDRICRIFQRYERLYVLICHSASEELGGFTMDDKTADSFRSLVSFCASLNPHCHVSALLVPTSPEPLSQWIISLSNLHNFSRPHWADDIEGACLTPEDPTIWELFLRHAGLNSYAAQAVLSLLGHRPQDAITHFVSMDSKERENKFGPILGGKVMSRVNKALSVVW